MKIACARGKFCVEQQLGADSVLPECAKFQGACPWGNAFRLLLIASWCVLRGEGRSRRGGHPLQDGGRGRRRGASGRRCGGDRARPPPPGGRHRGGGGGASGGGGAGAAVLARAGGESRGAGPGTPKASSPEWLAPTAPHRTPEALAVLQEELSCANETYLRAYFHPRWKNHQRRKRHLPRRSAIIQGIPSFWDKVLSALLLLRPVV